MVYFMNKFNTKFIEIKQSYNRLQFSGAIRYNNLYLKSNKFIIDTGCSNSVIPIKTIMNNDELLEELKLMDLEDENTIKQISFGVNDNIEEINRIKELYKNKQYNKINEHLSMNKKLITLEIQDVILRDIDIRINYSRIGNPLIGMDILSKFDIHIGPDKTNNGIITLIGCPLNKLNDDYYRKLDEAFGLGDKILTSEINDY